jgi:Holliday junction DNA helicase RuvA
MIARLQGVLVRKRVDQIVVDVHGVGYQLLVPLSTYYTLPDPEAPVSLLTTMYVREDTLRLYGFATASEQDLFELLLGVSSIGPRLALNMLSSLAAADLQQAIAGADLVRLQRIPGIGRKTAERVILELKDKVALLELTVPERTERATRADDQLVDDVISALLNLGYKRTEAEKAVQAVQAKQDGAPVLETLLRDTLRLLAHAR